MALLLKNSKKSRGGVNGMSKFSVYLRTLLDKSGEPISRIAEKAGVERTSIHKALKDERILSYVALKRLIQYLELTLPEIRELNQYYEMLLQGEDIYEIQESICELLSDISQLHFSNNTQTGSTILEERTSIQEGLVYGKPQVEKDIRYIMHQEILAGSDQEICLFLPQECFVPEELIRLWEHGKRFQVNQLVAFRPNHSGEGTNLANFQLLQQVIPMALISNGQYFAYYYFEDTASSVSIDPFPYFIITPHFLIRMNQKMSMAQVQTSSEVIELYQKYFIQVREECQILISYTNDLVEVLGAYMDATATEGYFTTMLQPCFGRYYTRELIQKYFHGEEPWRSQVIEMANQRMSVLRDMKNNYYTIFSETGLVQFAETGIIVDLPPEYVSPLDVADRLEILRKLRDDVDNGSVLGCIVDGGKLSIPPYLTMTSDPKYGVHFYTTRGFIRGAYTCNLHIQGANIGKSFCEFIKSMPNSKFVYPKEKNIAVLDRLIHQLEEAGEGR